MVREDGGDQANYEEEEEEVGERGGEEVEEVDGGGGGGGGGGHFVNVDGGCGQRNFAVLIALSPVQSRKLCLYVFCANSPRFRMVLVFEKRKLAVFG